MAVFESFRDGWTALRTTPSLLLAGGLLVALPLVGALDLGTAEPVAELATVLALPFVLGGFLAMATTALRDGDPSLRSFVHAGGTNYLRLVGGLVLFVFGLGAVLTVVMTLSFAPIVLVALAGGADFAAMGASLGAVVAIVGSVAALAAGFLFLQFFAPAIVVEDRSVADSFRRSVGLVRRKLASAVGFTLLWAIAVDAVPTPRPLLESGGAETLQAVGVPGEALPVAVAVVGVVSVVGLTYCYIVYVAYFLRLTGAVPTRHRDTEPADSGSVVGTQ
ncbi:hypothetical protein [Haloarcula salinisoli]|uniref:DUF7847 domain-containing protein n=1 Tax=Haloarcula salinisoli TaxID=2487746 RepID=A0A8J8C9X9_9EURY|nr:hypothetical protein [Halomicroarcula salinisoli]MBX0302428.1 hypothetical protein [Halomicroarcula salinisoli]